jgi:uncharacterized membrane-anchored protein
MADLEDRLAEFRRLRRTAEQERTAVIAAPGQKERRQLGQPVRAPDGAATATRSSVPVLRRWAFMLSRDDEEEDLGAVKPASRLRRSSPWSRTGRAGSDGQVPVIGRIFPAPVAAKVPEVIFLFWVVKILTTAGGEATSDYLKTWGNIRGGATEVVLFVVGIVLQFGTRRYRPFAYWFLAYAIAIFGTGVSDFLHLDVKIPYAGTTLLWTVVLLTVFWVWNRNEGTLSIHSITTQRREAYYWATVFATFALGTALGDFTATSLGLGYLASGVLFAVVILIPALAWRQFSLNSIAAFWMSYVVTRPLGASFADYIGRPRDISGIGFGDGQTAVVFAVAVAVLVAHLAMARPDIQRPLATTAEHGRSMPPAHEHHFHEQVELGVE